MKKLKLNSIVKSFKHDGRSPIATTIRVCDLTNSRYWQLFDFDVKLPSLGCDLQRKLLWNLEQKQELILSILKGIKLPNIVLIQLLDDTYQVIDGKQRLHTIRDFMDNKFAILVGKDKYFFRDFDSDSENALTSYNLMAIMLCEEKSAVTDSFKVDWFEFVNFKGTPVDASHLSNLRTLQHKNGITDNA